MRIYICDDEVKQMEYVEQFVRKYVKNSSRQPEALECIQLPPGELVRQLEQQAFAADVIILDIALKGRQAAAKGGAFPEIDKSGIALARRINEQAPDCQIIFLTGYIDLAPMVYEAEHLYFVLKTQLEDMLPRALEKAFAQSGREGDRLTLNISNYDIKIPLDRVLYIEKRAHNAMVMTERRPITFPISLKELEARLGTGFVRCQGSFIVNLRHVETYRSTEFVMKNKTVIPIGRTFQKAARKAYLDYLTASL